MTTVSTEQTTRPAAASDADTGTLDAFVLLVEAARSAQGPAEFSEHVASIIARHFGAALVGVSLTLGDQQIDAWSPLDDPSLDVWRRAMDTEMLGVRASGRAFARAYGKGEAPECALIASPVATRSGQAIGAIGVLAPSTSRDDVTSTTMELRMLATHVAHAMTLRQAKRPKTEHFEDLERVFSTAGSFRSLHHFAYAVTNNLCTRLGAEQVSLGWKRGDAVRLLSISGADKIKPRSPGVHRIQQAMDECLDAASPIICQSSDAWGEGGSTTSYRLHGQWRASAGGASVASIPILAGDECVAVVSLRRDASSTFSDDEIALAQRMLAPLGGAMPLVRSATQPLPVRAAASIRRSVGKIGSRDGTKQRILSLLVLAPLFWVIFGWHTYRVTVPAVVAAAQTHMACAPIDGRIAEVLVEPGQNVMPGDALFRMDTTAMLTERDELVAESRSLALEVQQLASSGESAAAVLANARRELVEARLRSVEDRIERSTVRAGHRGVVLGPDATTRSGESVAIGTPILSIAGGDGMQLELMIPERRVTDVEHGATISFQSNARPESTSTMVLESVSPSVELRDGKAVFVAEAPMDTADTWLRPGMEGVARIEVGDKPVWWILFHRAIDYTRMELMPG
ncbi:MAG: HlyD family efflux transporter periplasmic adaptor subunit [Planctomycetota bacterium]